MELQWPIAQIVYQHHERMDGSGYPSGLSGEDIILEARILAVADVVEAIASHRPYRPALGIDKALDEISQKRGILYDSEVVSACLALFKKNEFRFDQDMQLATPPDSNLLQYNKACISRIVRLDKPDRRV
jgi:HD-GYP domain-containing protein (c-di-GMP phosphodiesterase class II)